MRVSVRNKMLMVVIPIVGIFLALINPVNLSSVNQRHSVLKTVGEESEKHDYNNNRNGDLIEQNPTQIEYIGIASVRPIHDYRVTNLFLASDIEGGLHALNRETGEVIWSIEGEKALVEVSTNSSDSYRDQQRVVEEDPLIWMVEPYGDGNLYFFNREIGLNRLPVSISHLVLQSPFALANDDKIYTGVRKSSLYLIDIVSGEILSSYGTGGNHKDHFYEKNHLKPSNTILLGKTTYELSIHSKENNISWNVTYSTWGPNNIDLDLAQQNKIPLDGTYVAPFHDHSLLAIDLNSKIAKWVSNLPETIVNVFDIVDDFRHDITLDHQFICLPHPLKSPSLPNDAKNEGGTYIDMTHNGSWYAMSADYYPSLVKSAPTSRYSLSERWRGPQIMSKPEEFNNAITGVHLPNENDNNNPTETRGLMGYPTSFPQQYPYHLIDGKIETLRTHELATYDQPPPPSRADMIGVPSSSSPVLQIDPSPRSSEPGFFDSTVGKFIFRCFENLLMVLILSFIIFVFYKLNWIPSLNVVLERNGFELKEVEVTGTSIQINSEAEPNNDVTIDDIEPHSVVEEKPVIERELPVKIKKEVTIIEPPLEDRPSNDPNNNVLKKRKRGSRGGKKNKKNSTTPPSTAQDEQSNQDPTEGISKELEDLSIQQVTKPTGLTISDQVLGYGSYGTVVYKGCFQSRDVAVKRMLIDFYDVANHEINLLTESDDHPNVIRYFYSETSDKFLYIALELCSASLEDVIDKPENHQDLVSLMEPVNVLKQIAQGLHHLHSLKIVHRDIKPQNILVAPPKKLMTKEESFSPVRVLISDFGLCKRLEADESSFKATTQHAAGTSGWRAPELLLDGAHTSVSLSSENSFNNSSNSIAEPLTFDPFTRRKLTRAIDIFSMGCVFFYILTNGCHPFGERYLREGNVIKNEYSLEALEILPVNLEEAKNLISIMIARNPKSRPSTAQVLTHPFFWSNAKKLEFLLKVSDRFEVEQRDPPSDLLQKLEAVALKVIGEDWCAKFDRLFIENLGKYRKYHPDRLMDLLRALRNKYHHFHDLPPDLVVKMSPLPDGFYQYFNRRFPNLLMEIYHVVEQNLKDDHILATFF